MLGPRAFEKLSNRKTPVATYMNDLTLVGDYWGWYGKRFYHHTGMVSMTYAMREALEVVKVCACSRHCPVLNKPRLCSVSTALPMWQRVLVFSVKYNAQHQHERAVMPVSFVQLCNGHDLRTNADSNITTTQELSSLHALRHTAQHFRH